MGQGKKLGGAGFKEKKRRFRPNRARGTTLSAESGLFTSGGERKFRTQSRCEGTKKTNWLSQRLSLIYFLSNREKDCKRGVLLAHRRQVAKGGWLAFGGGNA